jgi:hypothetical protein
LLTHSSMNSTIQCVTKWYSLIYCSPKLFVGLFLPGVECKAEDHI